LKRNDRLAAIQRLLDSDPLCLQIVTYLTRNTEAADTAQGIAEWWIGADPRQTARALRVLLEHGVVRSISTPNTASVYAFTRDAALRKSLAGHVHGLPERLDASPR
jgi:hypothetical protein